MKIVLASSNLGKLGELQLLLGELGCTLLSQTALGIASPPEPFDTFIENALTKARHATKHAQLPAIADDAGLCVDAFGGEPGVHTADYAARFGYPKGSEHNIQVLLQQLQGKKNRRAHLVCTLVALRHEKDPEPLITQGRITGEITQEAMGGGGFGFDSVLWIPEMGKTLAQLTTDKKNAISHRGIASKDLLARIQSSWF